jgi:hypothetical protein
VTGLQDQILDRLVGATASIDWPNCPLTIAAEVVGGTKPIQFGLSDNDRGAKSEIARRLGYPVLLCEAIQGGNRGLTDEDDRRSFAMTIFSTLPIGGKAKRLAIGRQIGMAMDLAARAHRQICPADDCPVAVSLERLLQSAGDVRKAASHLESASCPLYRRRVGAVRGLDVRKAASTLERSIYAVSRIALTFREGKCQDAWASVREAARVAATAGGVGEAVACCVGLARGCGMTV